ncbi:hypothetical protein BH10PAT3_BH10PAT3_3190 [soil metagenome]
MEHDKKTRYLHFSDTDMRILGIEITPLKDTQAARLRRIAESRAAFCTQEILNIYLGSEFDSTTRQTDPFDLRVLSESATRLALELAVAEDFAATNT